MSDLNPQGERVVFDADAFQIDQRRAATEQAWERLVDLEASARRMVGAGVFEGTRDGQPVVGVIHDEEEKSAVAERFAADASALRTTVMNMLAVNGIDELPLIERRVGVLTARASDCERDLASWEDLRDSPESYGGFMLDNATPIDHVQAVVTCSVREATLTDLRAELAFYTVAAVKPK